MTVDSSLLAILAIAVSVLGVIATLIAPRLTREARVHADIFSVDRIRRVTEAGDLRIEVHHGADLILEPVFIVRGNIQNIGGRDLVASHFVDPINVFGTDGIEILSLEASPPPGVTSTIERTSNGWGVRWNILKPKEKIPFLAVARSTAESVSQREVRKNINVEARLKDVKSGYGLISPDIRFGLTVAMSLMIISVGPVSYLGMRSVDSITYEDERGVRRILLPSDGTYNSCEIKNGPIYFRECRDLQENELANLHHSVLFQAERIGISQLALVAISIVAFLYGFLFAFSARSPTTLIRAMLRASRIDRV